MELPNEILNLIFSYMQSPTSKIMKELYFRPLHCLKLNKKYNFKHINMPRLLDAICVSCPHCTNRLDSTEYIHTGIYESCFKKKLCFECIQKEKFRIIFEYSEISFILIIFFYVCITSIPFFQLK
jgi:hypothetical protein